MQQIDKNIPIEDLVQEFPWSVQFLAKKGIMCIQCGEPIWGTLEEAILRKKRDLGELMRELNDLARQKSASFS